MPNVFQLLETLRTDPGKKPAFVHIREFGEIYRNYEQQDTADPVERAPADRCLDYLEV